MKKLRLIKPWNLRTVRQRLSEERLFTDMHMQPTPCNAPFGDEACISRAGLDTNIRDNARHMALISHHNNNAPISAASITEANCRMLR